MPFVLAAVEITEDAILFSTQGSGEVEHVNLLRTDVEATLLFGTPATLFCEVLFSSTSLHNR